MGVTKLVDFVIRIPDQLTLHFYDFFVTCYAFLKVIANLFKLAAKPLNKKEKLQPGPSPAFSAVASCRWCSARQGLWGLQREGTLDRGVQELPTNAGVRVSCGRNQVAGVEGGGGAPRECEEAPRVVVVLGLRRNRPVHCEP